MARFAGLLLHAMLWFGILTTPLLGQISLTGNGDIAWRWLSAPAGTIFAGTVLRVERVASTNGEPATVQISFRVDDAVRGCDAGQTILLHEWAELWVNRSRYREGQKVLIFLYPDSDARLSSPVAGELGIIHIGPQGQLRLTSQQARFLSSQTVSTSSQSDALISPNEFTDSMRARLRKYLHQQPIMLEEAAQ